MKKIRIISFLLTLVMILSLFSGLTASAKTGTLKVNTGKRHELCTSLSAQAKAYYTGDYTYDKVSALKGGNESCLSSATTGSALFKKLNSLMTSTMTKSVSYSSLTGYWEKTDANNGSSDACLFYSDAISGSYNREHVWPKSRASFHQQDGGADLHHLRPTNSGINSTRSNYTMGNVRELVNNYYTEKYNGKTVVYYNAGYSSNGCNGLVEINDNIKGDVARIFMYVYVRWQERNLFENDPNPKQASNDSGGNNGYKVIYSLDTLLEWCENDPVDTWEMVRNDQCENVQGNRNVFIDYPEYAWLIFGQELPEDMPTPSGEAQNTVRFTITAKSNNNDYGTVTLSGKTITASPKEGYAVSKSEPFTVSPKGAAYVSQNGNVFNVSNVTADCTVTVNFEKLIPATVTYSVPEGVSCPASASTYVGYPVTLPTVSNVPDDFTFFCWSESFVERTIADSVPGFTKTYTPGKEETTLYAVFYYNEKQDGGWLYTSTPSLCDHENTEIVNKKDATCTENGNTGDTYCHDCENIIKRGDVIPALGHDFQNGNCTRCGACQHLKTEVRNAKEATCTQDGYSGDIHCTACGEKIYSGVKVKAMGHDYEDGACSRCGEKDPNASQNPDDPKPPVDDPKPPVDDPTSENPFKDVNANDYYAEPVLWAVEKGITNGTSASTFSPDAPCTRGQIVTFLWRACGSPEPTKTENPFTDVKAGEYYYKAVLWAVEEGITTGLSDTTFGPNATCTRGQVATFLWRSQGKPVPAGSNPFSDVASSDYCYDAVLWAVENSVTQGVGPGKFAPNDSCTRGQIVTFLYRAFVK